MANTTAMTATQPAHSATSAIIQITHNQLGGVGASTRLSTRPLHSRADYMNGKADEFGRVYTHEDYFYQLLTVGVARAVMGDKAPEDQVLTYIEGGYSAVEYGSLPSWGITSRHPASHRVLEQVGTYMTQAGAVCLEKAAFCWAIESMTAELIKADKSGEILTKIKAHLEAVEAKGAKAKADMDRADRIRETIKRKQPEGWAYSSEYGEQDHKYRVAYNIWRGQATEARSYARVLAQASA